MDLPLFAYGTLMPDCGSLEHLGLEGKLEDLGPATMSGELWLIASTKNPGKLSPGYTPQGEGIVHGHLWRVPGELWGVLDEWEGFVPHDPVSEYIRQEALTLEGEEVWVYVMHSMQGVNRLRDGDWRRYAFHPKAVPLFPSPNPFE